MGFFLSLCNGLLVLEDCVAHIGTWPENFVDHQQAGAGEVSFIRESHLQHPSHKSEHARHILVGSHGFEYNTEELVHPLRFAVAHFEDNFVKCAVESVGKTRFLSVYLHFLKFMGHFAELEQQL